MPSIPECPIAIVLATTSGCRRSETIAVSSWQGVARRANRNFCAIINDAAGRKLFFKHNLGGNFKYIVTDLERRRRDICNILASRILTQIFALHSVVYYDSFLLFADGHRLRGVACHYLEQARGLQIVHPREVINQQDAVCQMVVLTWLGDIDRLKNPGGDFVTQDGLYSSLDFDFCFNDGVSFFGLPIANRRALKSFPSSETVESMTTAILNLTDVDIAKMVARVGHDWIGDWSEEYQSSFAGVLIRNRERLRSSRALRQFGVSMGLWLWLLDDLVTQFYEKLIIPRKVRSIIRNQGTLATILELHREIILLSNGNTNRANSILRKAQISDRREQRLLHGRAFHGLLKHRQGSPGLD
jgi:hypothetical protein